MAYLDMDDILAAVQNEAPLALVAPPNFLEVDRPSRLEGLGGLGGADHWGAAMANTTQNYNDNVRPALAQAKRTVQNYLSRLSPNNPLKRALTDALSEVTQLEGEAASAYAGNSKDPSRANRELNRIMSTAKAVESAAASAYGEATQWEREESDRQRAREQEDYARQQYEAEQERKRLLEEQRIQRERELEERRIALEEQRAAREAQLEEARMQAQLQAEQQRLQMDLAMQQQQLAMQAAQEQARMQMEAQRAAMEQQLALQAAMPAPAAPQVSTAYYGVLPVGQGYAPGYGYDAWAQPAYGYEPNFYAAPPAFAAAPAPAMVDYAAAPAAWSPSGNEMFGLQGLGSSPPVPGLVMSPTGRWVPPETTVTVTRPNEGPGVVESTVNTLTSTVNALAPTALQFAELFTGRRSPQPSPVPVQQSSIGDWLLPAAVIGGGAYLLFGRKKSNGRRRGR